MSVILNKLVDVRIDSASSLQAIHDVALGPSNLVRQEFRPTSTSSSVLDFQIQTPGLATYMSRRVNLTADVPFSFTVYNWDTTTGANQQLMVGRDFGLEAWPGNSMIQSATVQISTSNFTTQMQQVMPLIKRKLNTKEIRRKLSEVPAALGQTAIIYPTSVSSFAQGVTLGGCKGDYDCDFGNAGDASSIVLSNSTAGGTLSTAGGFLTVPAATNPAGTTASDNVTPGSLTVKGIIKINEPLLIQPFEIDDETPSFINVNMVQVRLNLSDLGAAMARVIRFAAQPRCSAGGAPKDRGGAQNPLTQRRMTFSALQFDQSEVASLNSARLVCQFMTPPPTAAIPAKTIYPTAFYNPMPTGWTLSGSETMAPGTTREITSNVITLNTAPDAIAVYFVPTLPSGSNDGFASGTLLNSLVAASTPGAGYCMEDTLLSPTRLEVTWNNNPSLLATFDQYELWRRTQQNGVIVPWPVFKGSLLDTSLASQTGSQYFPVQVDGTGTAGYRAGQTPGIGAPVLLALNKDIPVEPGVAAGVAGVYTISFKATIFNHLPFAITAGTLYIVPITSQYLVLNAGGTSDVLGTVATEDAVVKQPVAGDWQSKELLSGGSALKDGFVAASARRLWDSSRVIGSLARGSAASTSGGDTMMGSTLTGGSYAVKRQHLNMS